MKIFTTKTCAACEVLKKSYPFANYVLIDDHLDEVQRLGIRGVPTMLTDEDELVVGQAAIRARLEQMK